MSNPALTPFDPDGPLPTGTLVLEASAGTGKTHALTGLARRYLDEGVTDAAHLAVITFSRSASGELAARMPDDVPVMTIHEFCEAMIRELGVLAAYDPLAVLVDDLSRLGEDLVRDEYLRFFAQTPGEPPFRLDEARSIAQAVIGTPDAAIVPGDAVDGPIAARVEFARAIRTRMDERKRRAAVYSFDDQLARLRGCVAGDGPDAQAARARLRQRCAVVLVDEFQDTDPVQWDILRLCFHGHVPLVLIGDPKQAVYGFRGADVMAYRSAVDAASHHAGLGVNYRADAGVVAGLNRLFDGVEVGPGIRVPDVEAHQKTSRLIVPNGSPWRHPVRLRCVADERPLMAKAARERVADDLVAQVADLLASGAQVVGEDGPRPLRGDDIAVIVRGNQRGRDLTAALAQAGVPAAFTGADSVFASDAAQGWLALLRALDQPRRANVRAAFVSDFIGATLVGLAEADEEQMSAWSRLLVRWSAVLEADGVAALFAAADTDTALSERLLARPMGERDLTDYRHLSQVLHARHTEGLSGAALVAWLADAIASPQAASEWTRKLETDDHAVQVMTAHRAKGMQFPVVLLPQAADLWVAERDGGRPITLHDDDGRRVLDVGGSRAPGRAERLAARRAEDAQDELRVLYVAATRAQSQVTLWWSRTAANTAASPLHRLLFRRRDAASPEPAYPVNAPPGDELPADLAWIAGSGIHVEAVDGSAPAVGMAVGTAPTALRKAVWNRSIDHGWRRTSYSGLTAGVHDQAPVGVVTDEPEPDESDAASSQSGTGSLWAIPSPMADLPGGTSFGTAVHHVLEGLDWYAPTPGDEPALLERLTLECADTLRRSALDVDAPTLATAMLPLLLTGLGPLAGGRRLADIPMSDRLAELDFEYPLGRGVRATSGATLADVGVLLQDLLPADDPLRDYPQHLLDPALGDQPLRGFLTGSIDAVLRVGTPQAPRFVVVDYKTNRITADPELRAAHYTQHAMAAEMIRAHYPLQALVYEVALHRFLGVRLPGYRPELHLGGVCYLFVRGMTGPQATLDGGLPTGVFAWHPPAEAVVALSELLSDAGEPDGRREYGNTTAPGGPREPDEEAS